MANASITDYQDVIACVQKYCDGCNATGDVAKPAFLESATINGAPIQTLFDGIDEAGPAQSQAQIDVLDIVGTVAVVRVTLENYHGGDYVDFHALMKTDEGWKIAAKVFTDK